MVKGNRRAAVLATAFVLAPSLLAAQARPMGTRAPGSAATPEAVRGWLTELEQIGERLQAAHSRVSQDAELQRTQEALMRDMKTAMLRVDPELDRVEARARAIVGEMNLASQRNDRAAYQRLAGELGQLRQRVVRAEGTVMQQPTIAQRARSYEAMLRRKMTAQEPRFEQLLERSRELQTRLQRAASQGVRPAPPRRTP